MAARSRMMSTASRKDLESLVDEEESEEAIMRMWAEIDERRRKEQTSYMKSARIAGDDNPRCFIDFTIGDISLGRVQVELFADTVPKTAENFRRLCTGEAGFTEVELADGSRRSVRLDLAGSVIHRVMPRGGSRNGVPGGYVCGGDIVHRVGLSGLSTYGAPFPDESFRHRHTRPMLLSMMNHGPNTNTSLFCITTAPCPQFDYSQVVFGKVTDGQNVIERMEQVACERTGTPKEIIYISLCGQMNRAPKDDPDEAAKGSPTGEKQ